MMDVQYDESKFVEMLLYVAGKLADDRAGGATKLNKVMYFADFAHVRRHGRPISGAEYFKLENGPAPRRLVPVRQRLITARDAELRTDYFLGFAIQRLVPRRRADLSVFEEAELATIDGVVADLASLTAKQVSDLSHEDPALRHTELQAAIPYELALVPKEQVISPAAAALAAETARRYGLAPLSA